MTFRITVLVAIAMLCVACDTGTSVEPKTEPPTEESPDLHQVTVTAIPSTSGSVAPQSGTFEDGTTIDLTATAADGWRFVRWEGDLGGIGPSTPLTVDADKDVRAVFEKRTYPLTLTMQGEGTVQEERVDAPKNQAYPHQAAVRLTAQPTDGWRFVRWEEDLSGSTNPETVVIDEAKTVRAVFMPAAYTLQVDVQGGGRVHEERMDEPKNSAYPHQAVVRLTAQPDPGWTFARWEGDLNGSVNPQSVTVDNATYIVAVFERNQYAVSTSASGNGQVAVALVSGRFVPSDPASGEGAGGTYAYESEVEVTAEAAEGWRFSHWEGDLTGHQNPGTLTVDEAKEVHAVFVEAFGLAVTTSGQGRVVVEPEQAYYPLNAEVTLTAQPDPGWLFVGWSGSVGGVENPQTLTMTQDVQASATFEPFDGAATTDFRVLTRDEDTGLILRAKATIENQRSDLITLTKIIVRDDKSAILINQPGAYILGPDEGKTRLNRSAGQATPKFGTIDYHISFFYRAPRLDCFMTFDTPIAEQDFESYTVEWYLEYGDARSTQVTRGRP